MDGDEEDRCPGVEEGSEEEQSGEIFRRHEGRGGAKGWLYIHVS